MSLSLVLLAVLCVGMGLLLVPAVRGLVLEPAVAAYGRARVRSSRAGWAVRRSGSGRIALFLASMVIWYLFSWPYDFRARAMDWQISLAGGVFSLVASLLFVEVFPEAAAETCLLSAAFSG